VNSLIYLIIVIFFSIIYIFDFLKIYKDKNKLEIGFYLTTFILSFVIIFIRQMDVNIPGPDIPIKYFIENILKLH